VIRILIDRERCVGSGNCLFWAPGTFDLDDSGTSVVVDPEGDDPDRIRVAVEGCPTRAISVEEAGGPEHVEHQGERHADRTDR
jgi:ferredoxin